MMLDKQRIGYASLETRQEGEILKLKQSTQMKFPTLRSKIELETELQTEENTRRHIAVVSILKIRNPPNKPTLSGEPFAGMNSNSS